MSYEVMSYEEALKSLSEQIIESICDADEQNLRQSVHLRDNYTLGDLALLYSMAFEEKAGKDEAIV